MMCISPYLQLFAYLTDGGAKESTGCTLSVTSLWQRLIPFSVTQTAAPTFKVAVLGELSYSSIPLPAAELMHCKLCYSFCI